MATAETLKDCPLLSVLPDDDLTIAGKTNGLARLKIQPTKRRHPL
jgi:hypothetical protein